MLCLDVCGAVCVTSAEPSSSSSPPVMTCLTGRDGLASGYPSSIFAVAGGARTLLSYTKARVTSQQQLN